jgi:hypothetical protein
MRNMGKGRNDLGLEIIGSGFGRTGTSSTRVALQELGFGPCHHMAEVFMNPDQVAHWQALAAGEDVDLDAAFEGYRATLDWPATHVWSDLHVLNPDAKVLHTVRPEDKWVESFAETIGLLLEKFREIEQVSPHGRNMLEALDTLVGKTIFEGRTRDRDVIRRAYRQRNEEVQAIVPPEQLLVYDVAEGWEPLCAFLGVPVPDTPFPYRNDSAKFWDGFGGKPV